MTIAKRRRINIESERDHCNHDFSLLVEQAALLSKKKTKNAIIIGTALITSILCYIIANLIDTLVSSDVIKLSEYTSIALREIGLLFQKIYRLIVIIFIYEKEITGVNYNNYYLG